MPVTDRVRIVPFADHHARAFHDLNLDWIEEYFTVEDIDRQILQQPQGYIVDPGGAILMAELDGAVIGCCALIRKQPGIYEVSKMAVTRDYRGQGIGRLLLAGLIERARAMEARTLMIISNTVLGPAIHLYKDMGFREIPLSDTTYARGNIALEYRFTDAPRNPPGLSHN